MLKWFCSVPTGRIVVKDAMDCMEPEDASVRGTPPAEPEDADCLIVGKKEFDELLVAADKMLAVFLDDTEAANLNAVRRRVAREANAVSRLRAAIAACEEVRPC